MTRSNHVIAVVWLSMMLLGCVRAQDRPAAQSTQASAPTPAPATKLEGFKPAAGSVLTIGFDSLGKVAGISVDVREMRDSRNTTVRGLLVDVTESEYRQARSFVDADEIPELLKGFDALLEVRANPTQFKNFEVRYTTRGELELTAFNTSRGPVLYAVQAGRGLTAQRIGLSLSDMQTLRGLFDAASQKLASLGR